MLDKLSPVDSLENPDRLDDPMASDPGAADNTLEAQAAITVSPERFRNAMASVCAPVTVVTAVDAGRPHGTTVSAFSSLSLEPPLIMVSLDQSSDLLAIVRESRSFGVNLLSHFQHELALRFARKGQDKFSDVRWRMENGLPRLAGVSGWLACDVHELVEAGDHVVAIGLVLAAEPASGAPLVYHDRQFGTHSHFVGIDAPEPMWA
jgi:flavin reductase (DIM6/NTAB) family NADH-FMN oxidoreductase RutF